jgi:hypothetical protein
MRKTVSVRFHNRIISASRLALFLFVAALPSSPAKGVPSLFGIIFDSQDSGVPGLTVRATPADYSAPPAYTSTDSRGVFHFETLPSRFYVLDVIGLDRKTLLNRSSVDLQKQKRVVIKISQIP